MRVHVVYAGPDGRIHCYCVELLADSSCGDAISTSGVLRECPEIRFDAGYGLAVFGRRADLTSKISDGDRIEILRALLRDPKDARRVRARSMPRRR